MKNGKWIVGSLVGLALGVTGSVLHAQPDWNNPPKAGHPPNQQGGGPRGGGPGGAGPRDGGPRGGGPRGGGPRDGGPDFRNLTPEQRRQFDQQRQQMRALEVRGMLTGEGITDQTVQDAVVAFVNEQEKTRQTLREKTRAIAEAMHGDGVTDAQLATLLAAYRAAADDAQDRRKAGLKALDKKIGYTARPRLDALLTLAGITSEEGAMPHGPGGRGPGGPGGRGPGRPGGFGGPGRPEGPDGPGDFDGPHRPGA